jgi:ribose transport system substrate-binding protein
MLTIPRRGRSAHRRQRRGQEHPGQDAVGRQHAGKSGQVKLATFDADTTQVADLKNGSLQLAIAQEPAVEGADAVQQGLNAIEGKPVTKQIATPL